MNGQAGRQRIVRQVVNELAPAVVIETGTFRGVTTEFLHALTGAPVHTVEANRRFHDFSRRRFAGNPAITTHFGDSRAHLRDLAAAPSVPKSRALIYLDAHWEQDLPLAEELDIITDAWSDSVVIVDDFAVTGDDGYRYDDYGPGKALSAEYLPDTGWTLLFPTIASSDESGARRGSCFLAPEDVTARLLTACELRRA